MSRKYSIIAVVVFIVLFGGWKVTRFFALRQINGIFDSRAPVQFKDLDLFFLGATATSATGVAGKLPVELQDIMCRVSPARLLQFSIDTACDAKFLTGPLSIQSTGARLGGLGKSTLDATLNDAQLARYPLALLLGIESGSLDVALHKVHFAFDGNVDAGNLEASIHKFSIPQATKLPPSIFPIPITIPSLKNLDADALATIHDDTLQLQSLQLASSLGSVEGSGTIHSISKGNAATVQMEFQFNLSDSGIKQIEPWLNFLPGGQGLNGTGTVSVSGSISNPRVQLVR